jgi:hypothetical protein
MHSWRRHSCLRHALSVSIRVGWPTPMPEYMVIIRSEWALGRRLHREAKT